MSWEPRQFLHVKHFFTFLSPRKLFGHINRLFRVFNNNFGPLGKSAEKYIMWHYLSKEFWYDFRCVTGTNGTKLEFFSTYHIQILIKAYFVEKNKKTLRQKESKSDKNFYQLIANK